MIGQNQLVMRNMKLTIKDRLSLIQILPVRGSVSEMVDVYDLARELKLNDEEKKICNYKEDNNGGIKWDPYLDPMKDVKITSDQYKLLMQVIDEMDKQKNISLSLVETILKLKGYGEYNENNTTHS